MTTFLPTAQSRPECYLRLTPSDSPEGISELPTDDSPFSEAARHTLESYYLLSLQPNVDFPHRRMVERELNHWQAVLTHPFQSIQALEMLERAAGVSSKSSRVADLMEEKKRAGKEIVAALEEVWKAGRFPLDRTWKRRVRLAYCGWDEVDGKVLKELFELERTRMLENDSLKSSPLGHSIPEAIWVEPKSSKNDCDRIPDTQDQRKSTNIPEVCQGSDVGSPHSFFDSPIRKLHYPLANSESALRTLGNSSVSISESIIREELERGPPRIEMESEDTLQLLNQEAPDTDVLEGHAELKPQNSVDPMKASSESQFVPGLNRAVMEGKCQQNEYLNTPSKKTETGSRGYPSHIDTFQDERGSGGNSYSNDAKYSVHSGHAELHRAVSTAIPEQLVSQAGISASQPHSPHPTIPMTPEKSAFLTSERLDIHDSGKWHKNIADELGCSDYEADSDPEPVVLVGWDT